jgi:Fic family protein
MSKQNHHSRTKSHSKEGLIVEFCLLIKQLFPSPIQSVQTNEKYTFLLDQLDGNDRNLVQLLIHHLAQLYQNHRIQRANKIIEIADEDILTALKIIENTGLIKTKPTDYLSKTNRNYYLKIRGNYKEKFFTCRDIQSFLTIEKSQSNRLLSTLLEHQLLEKYGYPNKGFYYKIKEIKSLEFIEKQADIDDLFDDFNDNEHLEFMDFR